MTITQLHPRDVVAQCREALGLPACPAMPVDDSLIAALLRHAAGNDCPCSRATLRSAVLESLQFLTSDPDLPDRVDDALEALVTGGDLLELSSVTTDDASVKGTWVFAAPPSFVMRPGGTAFLIGVVPDQATFLPQSLASRIVHEGFTRAITPIHGENLASDLREEGLQQLSETAWLKSPKPERAEDMLDRFQRRLASQPPSGAINDLQILDPAQPVDYYRGRWTDPARRDGTFVARRPQEFGAPIWCFVAVKSGAPVRILDLPAERTRWRSSDVAWHLQMAIDRCAHHPQLYRRQRDGSQVRFDFLSPLPQWAERRLMIFGRRVPREKCLMSYRLPASEADAEAQFLLDRLWLSRADDSD